MSEQENATFVGDEIDVRVDLWTERAVLMTGQRAARLRKAERDLIAYAATLGGNDVDCLVYADYYRRQRARARARGEWGRVQG